MWRHIWLCLISYFLNLLGHRNFLGGTVLLKSNVLGDNDLGTGLAYHILSEPILIFSNHHSLSK